MVKLQKTRNRNPKRRSGYRYRCKFCKYTSSRRYNVVRHEFRIHTASSRPRRCCDVLLKTKGEYYLHCEENHPDSRPTNITSRYKYKILPGVVTSQPSSNTYAVTSSPKKMPYMLRSRRPTTSAEVTNVVLADRVIPNSLESADEEKLENVPMENSSDHQQSSGYGTNDFINSTFDIFNENDVMNLSYTEEKLNELDDLQLPCLENTSEEVIKDEPNEFSENKQITAGHGGNTAQEIGQIIDQSNVSLRNNQGIKNPEASLDLSTESVYPEKSELKALEAIKSEDMKTPIDNESKENYFSLFTPTYYHLPPKKRILQKIGFCNRENIANAGKPTGDRLPKPLKLEDTPFRKKHRLSKKIKCRNLRKAINLSKYSSASSDAENVSPLNAATCKQNNPSVIVDFGDERRFTWDGITGLMREHLGLIDFDSYKVTLH